jgi:hypothetical protein
MMSLLSVALNAVSFKIERFKVLLTFYFQLGFNSFLCLFGDLDKDRRIILKWILNML